MVLLILKIEAKKRFIEENISENCKLVSFNRFVTILSMLVILSCEYYWKYQAIMLNYRIKICIRSDFLNIANGE